MKPLDHLCLVVRSVWPETLLVRSHRYRVTVFKTSRHSKLLFFVKNKGEWNAKSGPKVGDGKVAM